MFNGVNDLVSENSNYGIAILASLNTDLNSNFRDTELLGMGGNSDSLSNGMGKQVEGVGGEYISLSGGLGGHGGGNSYLASNEVLEWILNEISNVKVAENLDESELEINKEPTNIQLGLGFLGDPEYYKDLNIKDALKETAVKIYEELKGKTKPVNNDNAIESNGNSYVNINLSDYRGADLGSYWIGQETNASAPAVFTEAVLAAHPGSGVTLEFVTKLETEYLSQGESGITYSSIQNGDAGFLSNDDFMETFGMELAKNNEDNTKWEWTDAKEYINNPENEGAVVMMHYLDSWFLAVPDPEGNPDYVYIIDPQDWHKGQYERKSKTS